MQYRKIMLFFTIGLPISIIMRVFQLFFVIDSTNGFFIEKYNTYGIIITVLIFAITTFLAVFCLTSHRAPENTPEPNLFLSIASFFLGFAVIFDIFIKETSIAVSPLLNTLKFVFGFATAVLFLGHGFKKFYNFKIPSFCFIIPCLYIILKTITQFTIISALALISDNLLVISAYCAYMLFMLQFAKLYNNADSDTDFRKLLASGLVSVVLCLTQAVPYFIYGILNSFKYTHTSLATNLLLLAMGVFALTFTLSHYKKPF